MLVIYSSWPWKMELDVNIREEHSPPFAVFKTDMHVEGGILMAADLTVTTEILLIKLKIR